MMLFADALNPHGMARVGGAQLRRASRRLDQVSAGWLLLAGCTLHAIEVVADTGLGMTVGRLSRARGRRGSAGGRP